MYHNMVFHDIKKPADSIREGLKQVQAVMKDTINEIMNETNTFFTKRILFNEDKNISTTTNQNSSIIGSAITGSVIGGSIK